MKSYLFPIVFFIFATLIIGLNLWVEHGAYTSTQPVSDMNPTFKVVDYPVSLFTLEEQCVDEEHQPIACQQLTDIQTGDILVTKSNHTFFYRHGHAGVVVDAKEGLVLEALGYGEGSTFEPLEKWNDYPTVKVLRLKEGIEEDALSYQNIEKFLGIDYHLLAKKTDLTATHCADIVWKVFNQMGIDLDSNGGYFVTPKDIANSPYLFEVETYGFSPDDTW